MLLWTLNEIVVAIPALETLKLAPGGGSPFG